MSGIELAGLALGAFPILIHALESYREGAEVLKDWWHIQRAYKKCKHDLNYHRTIFEGNIERLLLPLVVDDDELTDLMGDPAGEAWEDEELEKRLKERLPNSYNLLLDIVGSTNSIMESLKKELGVRNPQFQAKIDEHGKLAKPNASRKDLLSISNIEFQAKRIKFSLKKSSRERLFMQLQDANDRMRHLLESSDQITAARRSREAGKPKPIVNRKINEFWQHARRLHSALSKAWQCSCASHTVNLQLQHRTSEQLEFDVLFDVRSVPGNGGWREAKIKMLPSNITANTVGVTINVPQRTPAQGTRQVRWTSQDDQVSQTNQSNMTKIKCLCSTLSQTCPGQFGYLDEDEYRFVVYPGDQTIPITGLEIVTLEKLLCDTDGALTRRKRYWLALTLASSYLQLCSTPWLATPLQKNSILFLRDLSSDGPLLLESPYVRGDMSKKTVTGATDAMVALGIWLLELCFGTSLENNKFRQQFPPGDATSAPILDYAAAVQWSKMVCDEAGPEFAEAVEWCLHAKELSDSSWTKEIWTHVIVPLDYCHKQVSQRLTAH
ncbi:hypothetical protein K505DRAFT_290273 [Melanomma pulvis-pyrius CBS 109.77]|uniref:DUF7580 domain-containing protein n=1 Tax=Melanomma pulvis-pyrius CBS 109.77 TaxID=1314802 RepID=A0A6A6WQK8_9PLEO|nr:hypothetical protein K505DRAFT_290273 [Melanomma pulvis-pyrius CBS 109.77]